MGSTEVTEVGVIAGVKDRDIALVKVLHGRLVTARFVIRVEELYIKNKSWSMIRIGRTNTSRSMSS